MKTEDLEENLKTIKNTIQAARQMIDQWEYHDKYRVTDDSFLVEFDGKKYPESVLIAKFFLAFNSMFNIFMDTMKNEKS